MEDCEGTDIPTNKSFVSKGQEEMQHSIHQIINEIEINKRSTIEKELGPSTKRKDSKNESTQVNRLVEHEDAHLDEINMRANLKHVGRGSRNTNVEAVSA